MGQAVTSDKERLAAFDVHAVAIAKRQYFQPSDRTLAEMFRRVARWVAGVEAPLARPGYEQAFYDLMASKRFCPGGRVLAGAETQHGNVLNCFVQDGAPETSGSDPWVLQLATKLALVTKVGGGNGLCLDPIAPKRSYHRPSGRLYLSIAPGHQDYDKVKTGSYLDLVHGNYLTKGYRYARFLERADVPEALPRLTVGDSVEGIWQTGGEMILRLLKGEDVLLELSELRPEGTPVKGSGGSSSGPSSFAVEVFDNFAYWASLGGAEYAGPVATLRYIFSPTLRVIRQGGTRRGAGMATLSITHPDVEDFITAKELAREEAEGDISTFNISVLVGDGFMEESRAQQGQGVLWDIALHAHGTGEPGLIFIDRINEHNPMRGVLGDIKSTNPCVTADTWVSTHLGARQVKDLVGKQFCAVVNGKTYGLESGGFLTTGVKPIFKVKTKRGFELRLTANHKLQKIVRQTRDLQESAWLELSDLHVGDRITLQNHRGVSPWSGAGDLIGGWLLGALIGDGTFLTDKAEPMACLDFWGLSRQGFADLAQDGIERVCPEAKLWVSELDDRVRVASAGLARLAASYDVGHGNKTVTDAIEAASYEFYRGFLRGLFDTDGSVQGTRSKGVSVRLSQSDLPLLRRVQRMLARLGILSTVYPERRPAGYRELPDGKGASRAYYCRADHDLVISDDNLPVFQALISFEDRAKGVRLGAQLERYRRKLNRERFADAIVAIEADGEEEVFDVTVEKVHAFDANGISAHNCGEIPLYAGEPCDLGAVNLAAYVARPNEGLSGFDLEGFRTDVRTCVRFLDNVLEVNRFALEDNREMSMKLRRLGLGVMGLADALILMGYRYDAEEGREAVATMIGELRDEASLTSEALAQERGAFPLAAESSLESERRNVALLTVAPTGTTSMLMGVSSGVEPVFAPFIHRKIGAEYKSLIHPLFKDLLERHPAHPDYAQDGAWDWEKVVAAVQENHGSVQGLSFIPDEVRRVLVCAHDIHPEDHVKMQGVIQSSFDAGGKMVANSISKTINLPNGAMVQDVYDAYRLAFETGCKGITVYRDGSRQFQVLSTKKADKGDAEAVLPATVAAQALERLPGEPLFDRPGRLSGFTDNVKLTLPNGEKRSFYITINTQYDFPIEVFIGSGKSGEEANADSEALGRMVSIALQYGVPAEAIVKTLRGINGGMYGSYQGRMVASKADLIAVALETAGVQNPLQKGKPCPDCNAPLRFEEGCQKCESCGYSKCG